jgi:hypothetical protein
MHVHLGPVESIKVQRVLMSGEAVFIGNWAAHRTVLVGTSGTSSADPVGKASAGTPVPLVGSGGLRRREELAGPRVCSTKCPSNQRLEDGLRLQNTYQCLRYFTYILSRCVVSMYIYPSPPNKSLCTFCIRLPTLRSI